MTVDFSVYEGCFKAEIRTVTILVRIFLLESEIGYSEF